MVSNGDSHEVYEKTAYEANGGGLLFRILAFEDTHYRDLNGCTILGFCGNKLFILDLHYDEQYASDSEEYAKMQRNRDLAQKELHFLYQRHRTVE